MSRESEQARRFRILASNLFAAAEQLVDPKAKTIMLHTAVTYSRLAEWAEEQGHIHGKLAEPRNGTSSPDRRSTLCAPEMARPELGRFWPSLPPVRPPFRVPAIPS